MFKNAIIVAGMLGFVGVAMGAFGAHALKARLLESNLTDVYRTASLYCLVHALALLAVGALQLVSTQEKATRRLRWASLFFLLGTLIFSGSLWVLAIFEMRWLGMLTPLGGLTLLAGWVSVLLSGLAIQSEPE